jgi:sugar (pentulose or hexulose) kinase
MLERLGHETLDQFIDPAETAQVSVGDIFATGGGSRSSLWLQLRADVSGRRVHRPACSESAFGTALLALAGAQGENLLATCRRCVKSLQCFEPNRQRHEVYQEIYVAWKHSLVTRGYLAG